jgi:hypothetical protein
LMMINTFNVDHTHRQATESCRRREGDRQITLLVVNARQPANGSLKGSP